MGFTPIEPVETLRVQKMRDKQGNVIELVQGNWHPHIAVNWYEDSDGNYIECVKYPEEVRQEHVERRLNQYDRDHL